MMIPLLGEHPDAHGEAERRTEVGQLVRADERIALARPARIRREPCIHHRGLELGRSSHVRSMRAPRVRAQAWSRRGTWTGPACRSVQE